MTTPPIIDAHHHIWRVDKTPWLQGEVVPRIFGDYADIQRDYPITEFDEDVRQHGVVKSVYVQINVAPTDALWEARWALDEGQKAGLCNAVTAWADFADPGVYHTLEAYQEMGGVRGIRQQLHWHENPLYRFAPRADLMADADWRRGFSKLSDLDMHFELQVFPGQYAHALDLIDAFPNQKFVLLHGGMPEDTSSAGIAQWQSGITEIAKRDNVVTKLSGFGTFTRSCEVALKRPLIERTVDTFGPDRCMFGSNFPIEKLWTSYAHLLSTVLTCLDGYTSDERRAIMHDTAAKLYRI